jgi:hypothetical protein
MRKALLLLALGLAACNLQGLPGSGEEGGFQLLNADELRMTIRYGDGAPFEGRLRVLEAEAPVVGGTVYLPLRTQTPREPDPYDLLCLGGGAFYVDLSPSAPSPRGGLYRADGSQARLLMYPKALPYRAPDYLWYLVPRGGGRGQGGAPGVPLPPPGPPSTTWSSPRGGTRSTTSPRTLGSTGPGCTVGRRPTGRCGPGRAGGALGPPRS